MTCKNNCQNPDCKNQNCPQPKEDQSTAAFREYIESNPSALEARIYDD